MNDALSGFSWQAAYASDLQSVYALWIAPLAFLVWRLAAPPDRDRAVVPDAATFVSRLTIFFAIETILDPLATGPLLRLDALTETSLATVIPFVFVLLGDWRVLLLAVGVARPGWGLGRQLGSSLAVSLIVPIFAGTFFGLARGLWPTLPDQVLWMLYEAGFLALCVGASRLVLARALETDPARLRYLRSIFGYSAAYYSLWLFADFLIVGLGLDAGWAVRIVPNQLYYAFWVPFVYFGFFAGRSGNAAR